MDNARHVIKRISSPRFLTYYDVPSTIHQSVAYSN